MHVREKDLSHIDDYVIYSKNKDLASLRRKQSYIIVSIDPGKKNFGFRIEKRTIYVNNPSYCQVETMVLCRVTYKDNVTNSSTDLYTAINEFFDSNLEWYKIADLVIVERQLSFNYIPLRVSQHCLSYFTILDRVLSLNLIVMDINAKVKSRLLSAPPKLNKRELKKWAVQEAERLFEIRGDKIGLSTMYTLRTKLDDISDATIQIEALFILLQLPVTYQPNKSILSLT